jgi:EmrB/QacA subfamily drug resistance transporter
MKPESVKKVLPWLVAVALFMESLDTTILNTAVPAIAKALDVAALNMKAALTSYTLALAVFIPISGWVADRFGTRRVFFTAISVFTSGSLLCGLSPNLPLLVAARILQGVGGSLMVPVGRISLVRTFAKSELLTAWNYVSIPALIGPLLGPLAGGFIVDYLHWRMIFFINLPMGLLGLWLSFHFMPDYRAERSDPLDFRGLALFGSGVAILSYVLEIFGETKLSMLTILSLLGLSCALLVGYGFHATRAKFPLLRLGLFRLRTFRVSILGSFITRLGAGGLPFLLPLLYQVGMGYSAVQSGLLIMPQTVAAIALKTFTPRILSRFGYRMVLLSNTLAIGLITVVFAKVGPGTPITLIVIEALGFGFFSSLQYTSINTLVFADLSEADTSMGSSIASTVQQMSMSFGIAVASLCTIVFLGGNRNAAALTMVVGIHKTFIALGILTVASALVFRELKAEDGDSVSRHEINRHTQDAIVHASPHPE